METFKIETPHFIAKGVFEKNRCIQITPEIGHIIGWSKRKIIQYCACKGWALKFINKETAMNNTTLINNTSIMGDFENDFALDIIIHLISEGFCVEAQSVGVFWEIKAKKKEV